MARTYAQLKSEVAKNIGRTDLDTEISNWVNDALIQVAREALAEYGHIFNVLWSSTSFTTTASTKTYSLPSDLLLLYDVVLIDGTNSRKLTQIFPRQFDKVLPYPEAYSTARPEYYIIWGSDLELYPIPDGSTYSTGTASLSGGTTVIGSGTEWSANVKAGYFFKFNSDGDSAWTKIESVDNDTQLTLSETYKGSASSGNYTIKRAYLISIRYAKYPASLSSDSDTNPYTGMDDLVIARATLQAFLALEDYTDATYWAQTYAALLKDAVMAERSANPDMGRTSKGYTIHRVYPSEYWNKPSVKGV